MALKHPSEYFKKEKKTVSVSEKVQEMVDSPELNTFSEAFESFKRNLNKIEVLSEFSDTLDNYKINIERVNYLSEKVELVQQEIQSLLKKEDLDRAMMSQLLVVEQSIFDIQEKVKGINEKHLNEIRVDVSELTETVNDFIELEVPKYKKLVIDSELRTNKRYEQLEENVNLTLDGIGQFVEIKYDELTENLKGINEKSLSGIIQEFKSLDQNVLKLKEEDIPKYKGFIVETERRTESKLNEFDEKLDSTLQNVFEKINETVENVSERIELIEGINHNIEQIANEKIQEVETINEQFLNELKNNQIYKDEINKKVSDLEVEILRNEKHIKNQSNHIETVQEEINKKVSDLEDEILRNEKHIKNQSNHIETVQEEIKKTISKLQVDKIEEQNYELLKKVKYLEEVFEKFNQETLTEGLLSEPPGVKNKDPLTPLNKNFVTLEQLQQHYRLFINRIQQQLSTLGGGGETRLKYLDDIVGIATNASAYDGKYLKYNHLNGTFEFSSISSDDDSWVDNSYGTYTNANVGIGTSIPTSKLTVTGDVNVSGIVTATSFIGDGSGLTNLPSSGSSSQWVTVASGISTSSNVGIGTTNPTSTLTVVGDSLFVGVVTATDFNSASDVNLKENISVIQNPIDKISKLEGVDFTWKENGKKSLGVIAQDVEKVFPELVSGEENKTVNYNGLIGLLIECVKHQQEEIENLKKRIDK